MNKDWALDLEPVSLENQDFDWYKGAFRTSDAVWAECVDWDRRRPMFCLIVCDDDLTRCL